MRNRADTIAPSASCTSLVLSGNTLSDLSGALCDASAAWKIGALLIGLGQLANHRIRIATERCVIGDPTPP
jgi:hypothetical protein